MDFKNSFKMLVLVAMFIVCFGIVNSLTGISTCLELQNMNDNLTEDYYLMNDINCSTIDNFEPIGMDQNNFFNGSFDGKGFVISNLYMNYPNRYYVGLFGYNKNGEIKNVGLEDVDITGGDGVGGLIGFSSISTINNSYSKGIVSGSNGVGGLIGYSTSTINNSYSSGSVNGTFHVGGLIGNSESTISNSYSTGNVNGENDYVGGLVGFSTSEISNSYSTGNVNGENDYVGGLVGASNSKIRNSYSNGRVNGNGIVGGLVGTSTSEISNSYSTGNVNGKEGVGGLVGFSSSKISNSYSTGSVNGNKSVGGFVGLSSSKISNSFYDRETANQSKGVGEGSEKGVISKTSIEMKSFETFKEWSNKDWVKAEGFYPMLKGFEYELSNEEGKTIIVRKNGSYEIHILDKESGETIIEKHDEKHIEEKTFWEKLLAKIFKK